MGSKRHPRAGATTSPMNGELSHGISTRSVPGPKICAVRTPYSGRARMDGHYALIHVWEDPRAFRAAYKNAAVATHPDQNYRHRLFPRSVGRMGSNVAVVLGAFWDRSTRFLSR